MLFDKINIARGLHPDITREALQTFDKKMTEIFRHVLQIEHETDNNNKTLNFLKSLPISKGGFGITALAPIAEVCHLSCLIQIATSPTVGRRTMGVDGALLTSVYAMVINKLGKPPQSFPQTKEEVRESGLLAFRKTLQQVRMKNFQSKLSQHFHQRTLERWYRTAKNSQAEIQWFKALRGKLTKRSP